jgi:hypothetical protein
VGLHCNDSPLHHLSTTTPNKVPPPTSMSSPRDNGAPVDSVNRPAFGYTLNLFCVFFVRVLFEI